MSRAAVQYSFGGPDVLEIREVPEPHAGDGQIRVRARAAGLNPVDWEIAASEDVASAFGVSLPAGFGNDFAGVVDEVGAGVSDFSVGDRVFGGARGRAVADHVVVSAGPLILHTPDGVDDVSAGTLQIAGRTADAALTAVGVEHGDTVLIGGATGGVGVSANRTSTIAAEKPPPGVRAVGGRAATPGALERIAALIADGRLRVPIAATYPIEKIRDAVAFQVSRHAHGKVVIVF